MNKIFITILGAVVAIFCLNVIATHAALEDVTFPIAELGDCADKTACRAYCNDAANIAACSAFAQEHKLISSEQAAKAQRLAESIKRGGPGGCRGAEECKAYCESSEHAEECLTFAEERGMILKEKAVEARKVLQTFKEKTDLPGKCSDRISCARHCQIPENKAECAAFAERAGLSAPRMELKRDPAASLDMSMTPAVKPSRSPMNELRKPMPPLDELKRLESKPTPSIAPEFLNGGATSLPTPAKIRPQSRSISSSLLGLFTRLFFGGKDASY